MQTDLEIRINKGDMRKFLIVLTVLLFGAYELQAQEYIMTVELNNGTKLYLNTNDVKEITFLEGKVVVSGSSLTDRIDSLAQVCSNNHYELSTAIKDNHLLIFQERLDQGNLILRSDRIYQSAKLESPDLLIHFLSLSLIPCLIDSF